MNDKTHGLRRWLFPLLLLLFVSQSGCGLVAYVRAENARYVALSRQLDAYAIPKPIGEVWEKVILVHGPNDNLTWSGLGFTWSDTAPWHKRTSTKKSKESGAGGDKEDVVKWYECEAVSTPAGTQVHYSEESDTTTTRNGASIGTQHKSQRRVDLEIELIRMFDPAAAQRIEAAGEAAAQKEK